MVPDIMARAFEPFFITITKKIGKGSELGLAQVTGSRHSSAEQRRSPAIQRVARRRRSSCRVPRQCRRSLQRPSRRAMDAAIDGGIVLVVDDDPNAREIAVTFLREAGYVVEEAGDGPEARDILAARPVCLALVDCAMPMMSGSEFVHLARQIQPDLPVVYVTGVADMLALREQGRDPIVMKPYSSATLLKIVRELMLGTTASALWRRSVVSRCGRVVSCPHSLLAEQSRALVPRKGTPSLEP
jgi:CheY-like chemotaxis protein